MRTKVQVLAAIVLPAALLAGCAAPTVDFTTIQRPERAPELAAYDVFVGNWDWKAKLLNAEGEDENWTGSAQWKWTLDERCLNGHMSVRGENAEFESAGLWSYNPKTKTYVWTMFNNWGYPQHGTASYDAQTKTWKMPYKSVGLDGTESYGVYTMQVKGNDTLEWTVTEWADMLHMAKKMEMTGTYTRK